MKNSRIQSLLECVAKFPFKVIYSVSIHIVQLIIIYCIH